MGFKEVQTLDADNVVALGGQNRKTGKKNPSSVEGYYLGSRKVDSPRAKNGYSLLHFFETSKGNLGVWGKTDLDRKLSSVEPGTMTRASHTGMKETPNGEMYTYKVEVDSTNTIQVSAALANSIEIGSDEEENDESRESEDYNDTEGEEEVVTTRLSAAQRKKEVEELLKGKR